MNFEDSRQWYLLHNLAIKSGGTKFNNEYIDTIQKKTNLNHCISKLSISDSENNSVTQILKKIWYEWYFTDMVFKTPIVNSTKKKIIKYEYRV